MRKAWLLGVVLVFAAWLGACAQGVSGEGTPSEDGGAVDSMPKGSDGSVETSMPDGSKGSDGNVDGSTHDSSVDFDAADGSVDTSVSVDSSSPDSTVDGPLDSTTADDATLETGTSSDAGVEAGTDGGQDSGPMVEGGADSAPVVDSGADSAPLVDSGECDTGSGAIDAAPEGGTIAVGLPCTEDDQCVTHQCATVVNGSFSLQLCTVVDCGLFNQCPSGSGCFYGGVEPTCVDECSDAGACPSFQSCISLYDPVMGCVPSDAGAVDSGEPVDAGVPDDAMSLPVGSACSVNGQCTTGSCAVVTNGSYSAQLCTWLNCSPFNECPVGSTCYYDGTDYLCVASCGSCEHCQSGQSCSLVFGLPGCLPTQ